MCSKSVADDEWKLGAIPTKCVGELADIHDFDAPFAFHLLPLLPVHTMSIPDASLARVLLKEIPVIASSSSSASSTKSISCVEAANYTRANEARHSCNDQELHPAVEGVVVELFRIASKSNYISCLHSILKLWNSATVADYSRRGNCVLTMLERIAAGEHPCRDILYTVFATCYRREPQRRPRWMGRACRIPETTVPLAARSVMKAVSARFLAQNPLAPSWSGSTVLHPGWMPPTSSSSSSNASVWDQASVCMEDGTPMEAFRIRFPRAKEIAELAKILETTQWARHHRASWPWVAIASSEAQRALYMMRRPLPGPSLGTLAATASLTQEVTRAAIAACLDVLVYMHRLNCGHGNISPDCILVIGNVAPTSRFVLTDWGVDTHRLKLMGAEVLRYVQDPHPTRWFCKAPEVRNGTAADFGPLDVWSLGATVLEVTLHRDASEKLYGDISNGAVAITSLPTCLAPTCREFCFLCLQSNIRSRPSVELLQEAPYLQGMDATDHEDLWCCRSSTAVETAADETSIQTGDNIDDIPITDMCQVRRMLDSTKFILDDTHALVQFHRQRARLLFWELQRQQCFFAREGGILRRRIAMVEIRVFAKTDTLKVLQITSDFSRKLPKEIHFNRYPVRKMTIEETWRPVTEQVISELFDIGDSLRKFVSVKKHRVREEIRDNFIPGTLSHYTIHEVSMLIKSNDVTKFESCKIGLPQGSDFTMGKINGIGKQATSNWIWRKVPNGSI